MLIFAALLLCTILERGHGVETNVANMVCFYDGSSLVREDSTQLSLGDLEPALSFCNYLIFGYAGIDAQSYELKRLNFSKIVYTSHYRTITAYKRKYPHLRVLLSVGGDKDLENGTLSNKYLELLEDPQYRRAFISSAVSVLRSNDFDGLDLAWQFPKTHPKIVSGGLRGAWNTVKGWFTGDDKRIDDKAAEHMQQFSALVHELSAVLVPNGYMLTLTVLPHVNSALFIDVAAVMDNLDFVNLATFDFQTPERDPKVADYPAPLYELYERNPEHNINYQVQHWLNNSAPGRKLNIGIAAYGRAWQMTKDSGITGYPPVPETAGVERQNPATDLWSWPQVCERLLTLENRELSGADAPLRKVGDPTRRYGTYAYRTADEDGTHGIWVGYEDPVTAATKAAYVHAKGLGGVALFDLSMDDFRGRCAGEKYPILRSIKYKL